MLNIFKKRDLREHLYSTKKISIGGIEFIIKKVDLMNYLDGSRVMFQSYDTHKGVSAEAKEQKAPISEEKARKHLSEVLVAGVVNPKLVFKKEKDDDICVQDLFIDNELTNRLYMEIIEFTYGKKKTKQLISAGKKLSSSI